MAKHLYFPSKCNSIQYIYIYIYIYVCVCVCIYLYIHTVQEKMVILSVTYFVYKIRLVTGCQTTYKGAY